MGAQVPKFDCYGASGEKCASKNEESDWTECEALEWTQDPDHKENSTHEVLIASCSHSGSFCTSMMVHEQNIIEDKLTDVVVKKETYGDLGISTDMLPMLRRAKRAKILFGKEVLCRALETKILAVELGCTSEGEILIGYEGAVAVAEGLKQLPHLEEVSLAMRYNCIGEEGARVLFDSFRCMASLGRLTILLGNNAIGSKGCFAAAECLKHLQTLTMLELNLWKNGLMTAGVRSLFDGLSTLTQLTQLSLNLDCNSLSEESGLEMAGLCKSLPSLTRLRLLLSDNRMRSGVRKMAEGWMSQPAPKLKELWLTFGKNDLDNEDMCALAKGLGHFQKLTVLKLECRSNSIGDEGAFGLAKGLAHLQRLRDLALGLQENAITDEGFAALTGSLVSLPELHSLSLDLRSNSLTSASYDLKNVQELRNKMIVLEL